MAVVLDRQLRTAVGQIGNANFLGAGFDDFVDAAKRKRRKVFAVRIARTILNGAGYAHVFLGFAEPRGDFSVVHGPVFADAVQIGGLEINVAKTRRGAAPEVCFPTGAFAALPIPVGAGSVRVGHIVLPDVGGFAIFGLFDAVMFLVRLVLQRERITVAAKLQVVDLAMAAVMFFRFGARAGVDGADFETGFAENFERGAAACSGANDHNVIDFVGHGQLLA